MTPADHEVCVCAAVRLSDGYIVRGHRHDDALRTAGRRHEAGGGVSLVGHEQGFITTRNRFVGRKEAAQLQKAAGIKSVDMHRIDFPDSLFSEDLY